MSMHLNGFHLAGSRHTRNAESNRLGESDRPAHDWYRFVLSFPPHLVRHYLERFAISQGQTLLDPFCGTGTTLVEAKKLGITSVGIEANPMACWASRVKVDWSPDRNGLLQHAESVASDTIDRLRADGITDEPNGSNHHIVIDLKSLSPETNKLLLTDSISPKPLHKALTLLAALAESPVKKYHEHERLAFATATVFSSSNLHFGPEVGLGSIKRDSAVVSPWLKQIRTMAFDVELLQSCRHASSVVHYADARSLSQLLPPHSIDAVITSPPYPNEKDYTRTTRLESVLLGFIRSKQDLQALKKTLVRSNTRSVYKDDDDHQWVTNNPTVERIAKAIEARRIEMGKTSGFERMYHRVTRLYFGGMARHLADLRQVLRPGAMLAYVVGDQASYLRIMIRTGEILSEIAASLGYEVISIDLFRTRLATATRAQLREEVVVLKWPG